MFFDGLPEPDVSGPRRENFRPGPYASWSRDGQMRASSAPGAGGGPPLRVSSGDSSDFLHEVKDPDDKPYRTWAQRGNRWLDNTRLIFWDSDQNKAHLWDTVEKKAKPIEGLEHPGEYVFSEDGQTLFALQSVTAYTDILLLELDPESIK